MAAHFDALLEAIVADPERGVRSCRCWPRRARQLVDDWNAHVDGASARVRAARSCSRRRRAHAGGGRAGVVGRRADLRRAERAAPTRWRTSCARWASDPKSSVGVCVERSPELVVGMLGDPQGRRRLRAARPGLSAGAAGASCSKTPRRAGRADARGLAARLACLPRRRLTSIDDASSIGARRDDSGRHGHRATTWPTSSTPRARPAAQGRDRSTSAAICNRTHWCSDFPLGRAGPRAADDSDQLRRLGLGDLRAAAQRRHGSCSPARSATPPPTHWPAARA